MPQERRQGLIVTSRCAVAPCWTYLGFGRGKGTSRRRGATHFRQRRQNRMTSCLVACSAATTISLLPSPTGSLPLCGSVKK
jgi:hypothetical protein